jgi:hypothetical protein
VNSIWQIKWIAQFDEGDSSLPDGIANKCHVIAFGLGVLSVALIRLPNSTAFSPVPIQSASLDYNNELEFIFISFFRFFNSLSPVAAIVAFYWSVLHAVSRRAPEEVEAYHGETLRLYRVTRQMMAAYMCIASNDVPPAVSKRVPLNVNCKSVNHFPLTLNAITIPFSSIPRPPLLLACTSG